MQSRILVCAALLCSPSLAQNTWIVNAGGGPGVSFATLSAAVAAASDGDTIIVQTGPFQEGADAFTTDKGLTIVGEGGFVPIGTSSVSPIRVENLPATSTFRMSGFSRPFDGKLHLHVENCQGPVHFGQMRCREQLNGPEYDPAVVIYNSDDVTLRKVDTYGSPAVQIDASRVVLANCMLGRTYIGIGGGQCLRANYSTVDIIQPLFDTLGTQASAIDAVGSDLRIVGTGTSYILNPSGIAIIANGGSIEIDPRVELSVGGSWGFSVAGTAARTYREQAGSFAEIALGGGSVDLMTAAPMNSFVAPVIGVPGPLASIPLGTLGIDVLQPYAVLPIQATPADGLVTVPVVLPAALPLGSSFATQAVVLQPGLIELALPCTFVRH